MRVLITGGDGFIGSHLAETFRGQDDQVAVLDNWETGLERPGTYECDVFDLHRFLSFASKMRPELIIHCAASYKDPGDWWRDVQTNVVGTMHAVQIAQEFDAKLVYFQTALPPVSSYAISKIAGEHYIRQSGVPHLIFRLANVYGPRNLSGPIPTFYKRLSAGEPCTVVDTSRDMVYIDDLVCCVEMALEQGLEGTFDVCSGKQTTIQFLYELVALRLEKPLDAEVVHPLHDDVPTMVDPKKGVPGWEPKTELAIGVANAVDWYAKHGVKDTYTHLALKG